MLQECQLEMLDTALPYEHYLEYGKNTRRANGENV